MLDQIAYQEKFENFIKMIAESQENGIKIIVVANKNVLGDTDEEYQESLRRLNKAELKCHSTLEGELN